MVDPAITKFLAALDETQYLAPDRMQAYQRRLLDRLLRHARSQTAFYADRLAPVFRTDDSIDWDRWTEIPILTRAEAQEKAEALKAREVPAIAGESHRSTTSGSTGQSFEHLTSQLLASGSTCASERFFTWHRLDPSLLAAFIRARHDAPYPDGLRANGWRLGRPESPRVDLNISTPIDKQIEWLGRVQPGIIATYPSNLREIGAMTADRKLLHPKALLTMGETVSQDTHAAIHADFGLEPLDQYGTSEIGHIAATCPHSGLYHIASELVLIEVVGEDGQVLPPGDEGRIVATAFYNLAMPFIRYDIGDYGCMSREPCSCGRTLPIMQRILGRTRHIFRFIDGSRKWPVLLTPDVQNFIPHHQKQVIQVAIDRIEFRYVPQSPDQVNDADGFAEFVKEQFHPSVKVDLVMVDKIDRPRSGKFEDYVSLLDGPEPPASR